MDFAVSLDIDLQDSVVKKMAINSERPPLHGKRF